MSRTKASAVILFVVAALLAVGGVAAFAHETTTYDPYAVSRAQAAVAAAGHAASIDSLAAAQAALDQVDATAQKERPVGLGIALLLGSAIAVAAGLAVSARSDAPDGRQASA